MYFFRRHNAIYPRFCLLETRCILGGCPFLTVVTVRVSVTVTFCPLLLVLSIGPKLRLLLNNNVRDEPELEPELEPGLELKLGLEPGLELKLGLEPVAEALAPPIPLDLLLDEPLPLLTPLPLPLATPLPLPRPLPLPLHLGGGFFDLTVLPCEEGEVSLPEIYGIVLPLLREGGSLLRERGGERGVEVLLGEENATGDGGFAKRLATPGGIGPKSPVKSPKSEKSGIDIDIIKDIHHHVLWLCLN